MLGVRGDGPEVAVCVDAELDEEYRDVVGYKGLAPL